MHVPIKLKSPNNISEWQKGFNSAFKGLNHTGTGMYQLLQYQNFLNSLTKRIYIYCSNLRINSDYLSKHFSPKGDLLYSLFI